MNLRMAKLLKNLCYILACAAALTGVVFERSSLRLLCLGIALALFAFAIAVTALAYRCPHCKRVLPKGAIPEKCPHCGEALR